MDFQWIATPIVGILGIVLGRYLKWFDRQSEKDRELIEKIVNLVPVEGEALQFLRHHDFGNSYRDGQTEPFWALRRLFSQPSYFFIDKKLEKAKKDLVQELTSFEELISTEVFVSDVNPKFWQLADPDKTAIEMAFIKDRRGEKMSDEEFARLEEESWSYYNNTKKKLETMANNICRKYDTLMIEAHKKL
jgi:hypothetical protein